MAKGVQLHKPDLGPFVMTTQPVIHNWTSRPPGVFVRKVITAARATY